MRNLSIPYTADLLITSGEAAKFCGMAKLSFMFELGRLKIPVVNLSDDQIADELDSTHA